MWLTTSIGFFNIIETPKDRQEGTLTIRARMHDELEMLRKRHLPLMVGPIQEEAGGEYQFSAWAARADVSAALADMVSQLGSAGVPSPTDSGQTILEVGCEGGSLRMIGLQSNGHWQFRVESREDFDDTEDPGIKRPWAHNWQEALKVIDQYPWPQLYPLYVHPEFRRQVVHALQERHRPEDDCIPWREWDEVLAQRLDRR